MELQKTSVLVNSQGRSRKGCLSCRSRRKKCDETQPKCTACEDRGIECLYPSRALTKPARASAQLLPRNGDASSREVFINDGAIQGLALRSPSMIEGAGIYHLRSHFWKLVSFSQQEQDNQFLTLIIPMAFDSVIVRSAMEATASAHLHLLGVTTSSEPIRLHSKALRDLSDALSAQSESPGAKEELLSACLILVFYEQVFGLSSLTIRWHLLAAKKLLDDLCCNSPQSPRVIFLTRMFAYFDIMVAFTLRLRPLADSTISSSISNTKVCPIFGYTSTIYPSLYSLACLLAQKHGPSLSRSPLDNRAVRELELDLLCWQPTASDQPTTSWDSMLPSAKPNYGISSAHDNSHERMMQTALAFKSAALLTVYDDLLPSSSPTPIGSLDLSALAAGTQYSSLINHLLRLNTLTYASPARFPRTTSSAPMINNEYADRMDGDLLRAVSAEFASAASTSAPFTTITWPLYSAAVRAKTPGDRAILSCIFDRAYQRHRIKLVTAVKQHVEDIWQGQDTSVEIGQSRHVEDVGRRDGDGREGSAEGELPLLM